MRKFCLIALATTPLVKNSVAFAPHAPILTSDGRAFQNAAYHTIQGSRWQHSLGHPSSSSIPSTELLLRTSSDDDDDVRMYLSSPAPASLSTSWIRNPIHAIAWPILLVVAFGLAPGELGSASDAALLQQIIEDPVHPGINPLFYTIFNMFAVVPFLLAALILPQEAAAAAEQEKSSLANMWKIPATPFLIASAGFGYFAMGPYLAFFYPKISMDERVSSFQNNLGWFTKNFTENKIVAYGLMVFTALLPLAAGLPEALTTTNFDLVWNDFLALESSSRFCFVSSLDLTLLYLTIVSLTVSDYQLRTTMMSETTENNNVLKVALLSSLLPFLGSALYLAWRPALPVSNEEEI